MRLALILLATAALTACGRPSPVADEAENASALPETNQSSPSPTGAAPTTGEPAGNVVSVSSSNIPAELHGRWGLTPRDCDSALGDARGLLIINANELRFYESRGVPAANVQTSNDSISGDFAFVGEGQQWTKHVNLELRDGLLVRTERDPVASFQYVGC